MTIAAMGDVLLPPKRQSAVDRLRRRFELYKRHHSACLPRHEQAAEARLEGQRQQTLFLKKRFLEAKAKKVKSGKSDHHRTALNKEATSEVPKLLQSKPVKRLAEESVALVTENKVEESERSSKVSRSDSSNDPKPSPEPKQQQSATPTFSVQIVQQFPNSNPPQTQTVQTNVTVQTFGGKRKTSDSPSIVNGASQAANPNQQAVVVNAGLQSALRQHRTELTSGVLGTNVECKQEKERGSDLCQCKTEEPNADDGNDGDRLSDTFPSISFAEDSGDDVIGDDILKHLIDDVFTNSADIMKDFNFDDTVESVKDVTEKNDIDELVKASAPSAQLHSFQQEGQAYANGHLSQQGGFCENSSSRSVCPITSIPIMPASTAANAISSTASLYVSSQRVPSYVGAGMILVGGGLGLDFKLTEPSPAALTLKQLAEQHQNMQQKQQQDQKIARVMNSTHGGRSSFGEDVFVDSANDFHLRFLNGMDSKLPNSEVYRSLTYDPIASCPSTKSVSSDTLCKRDTRLSDGSSNQSLRVNPKSQAFAVTRPLTHYQDASSQNNQSLEGSYPVSHIRMPVNHFQQTYVGLSSSQMPQMLPKSSGLKQQPSMMQSHLPVYSNYTPQTVNGTTFQATMPQSPPYPSQFGSTVENQHPDFKKASSGISTSNLPPGEDQGALQMNFHQFSQNPYLQHQRFRSSIADQNREIFNQKVNDWSQIQHPHSQVRSEAYKNSYSAAISNRTLPSAVLTNHSQFHQQYRIGQSNSERLVRSNVSSSSHGQLSHHPFNSTVNNNMTHSVRNSISSPLVPILYQNQQDSVPRQDSNQLNLDFLENIENNASDLLTFEQVMQGNSTHFQLLDDIEMLNK